jgi:hypothetical protein
MGKVVKGMRDLGGTVLLTLEDKEGKQRELLFSGIRCGISWPTDNCPGYFCVLGLLNAAKPGDPGSFLFLMEGEEEVGDVLAEKCINVAKDLHFFEFFTDRRKSEWMGFGANMDRVLRSHLGGLKLSHVLFAENFTLGRDLIKRWGKNGALKIPDDSIVHAQLVGKEPQNITGPQENQLYAINALRYVALAFDKIPIRKERDTSKDRVITVRGWA